MEKHLAYFTYLVDFCSIVALVGVMWKISTRLLSKTLPPY